MELNVKDLSNEIQELFELATQAKHKSYSPYSKFRVGCAIKSSDGRTFTGTNIENSSYGLTICAERTAFVKAVSEGATKFNAIVVTTDVQDSVLSPCGACRQFMAEFGECDLYMIGPNGQGAKRKISELLPLWFTPKHLDMPRLEDK